MAEVTPTAGEMVSKAVSTVDEVVAEDASTADEDVAEDASAADKVVAEVRSTADEMVSKAMSTMDGFVAEAVSTVDEVVTEAASAADEVAASTWVHFDGRRGDSPSMPKRVARGLLRTYSSAAAILPSSASPLSRALVSASVCCVKGGASVSAWRDSCDT